MKIKKTFEEQIKELNPKPQTYKERMQAFENAKREKEAKENPDLFAVRNSVQNILDIQSIDLAEKIAKKTNGEVWRIIKADGIVIFLYPITNEK